MKKSILFAALLGGFFAGSVRSDGTESYEKYKKEMLKNIYDRPFLGPYPTRVGGTCSDADMRKSDINLIFPDTFTYRLDLGGLSEKQKIFFCKKWLEMNEACLKLKKEDMSPNDPCNRRIIALHEVMDHLYDTILLQRKAQKLHNGNSAFKALKKIYDRNKVFADLKKIYEKEMARETPKSPDDGPENK